MVRAAWPALLCLKAFAFLTATIPFASADESPADASYRVFRGKAPEEIARYLAHPYPQAGNGIARALAEHGEKALPLVKRLLKDRHPGVRRGALATLGLMYARDESKEKGAEGDEEPPISPEVKQALALAAAMIDDPNPWVQIALGSVVEKIGAETEEMHRIVIRMGGSPDAAARAKALWLARHKIKDPATKVQVGIQVDSTPIGNTPRHWEQAHYVMQQGKDSAKPALPMLGEFLHGWAYRQRGMFSDSALSRGLDIVLHFAEDDAVLVTVPGLCRTHVRLTPSDYSGWVTCQRLLVQALKKVAPRARPAIRAAIESEKKFLATATDEELGSYGTNKESAYARLAELIAMVDEERTER